MSSDFQLGKVLGRGQFGTTRLAEDKKSGKVLACKSIAKRKLTYAQTQPPRCLRCAAAAGRTLLRSAQHCVSPWPSAAAPDTPWPQLP